MWFSVPVLGQSTKAVVLGGKAGNNTGLSESAFSTGCLQIEANLTSYLLAVLY